MTHNQTSSGRIDPVLFTSLGSLSIPAHAVVVADKNLPKALLDLFPEAVVVEGGESLKTLASVEQIAEEVLARRPTRPLTLVAVGGGSVGDAIGFLASVLWRGVELWHIPSTLLAMVDSAHGGKTAVNLGKHKNQLGTFHPASRVIIAREFLETLPIVQREQGLVELLKALWLDDAGALDLWDADAGGEALAAHAFADVEPRLMEVLRRAIDVKYRIVEEDPFETKEIRTFLNLGHTVAHALELHLGLAHGHAVAWGMLAAGIASSKHAGLSAVHLERLFRQLYPLLEPLHDDAIPSLEVLSALLARDKKKRNGELRSVLLRAPGEPVVQTLTNADWHEALSEAFALWRDRPIALGAGPRRAASLQVEASKSEVNRALVLAHFTGLEIRNGDSHAADVIRLRNILTTFESQPTTTALQVDAGQGGTTLRFALAVAATRPGETTITMHPRLFERPHDPLVRALREGGAWIDTDPARCAYVVRGWAKTPETLSVDASLSSQFASALLLLGASLAPGHSLLLELTGDVASRPYLDITIDLVRSIGVTVDESDPSRILLSASGDMKGPLVCTPDASSAAAWRALEDLGYAVELEPPLDRHSLQPDARMGVVLNALVSHPEVDLGPSPDLAPVIAAWAAVKGLPLRIIGAAHLRHKESNRIDDLVAELDAAGYGAVATADGLELGKQSESEPSRSWQTHDDHRLAFAALVIASAREVEVEAPWVVRKSYPRFYHDARRLGFTCLPAGKTS